MFDPANYVDILVHQLIKKPEAILSRLAADSEIVDIPITPLSNFLYCNGQALPLPKISDKERAELQSDMNKALDRLANWDQNKALDRLANWDQNKCTEVPQLNLAGIKKKHRERQRSHDSVYITAREETPHGTNQGSPVSEVAGSSPGNQETGETNSEIDEELENHNQETHETSRILESKFRVGKVEPGKLEVAGQCEAVSDENVPDVTEEVEEQPGTMLDRVRVVPAQEHVSEVDGVPSLPKPTVSAVPSRVPVCQYSSSPMVSKAYKPLSAALPRDLSETSSGQEPASSLPPSVVCDEQTHGQASENGLGATPDPGSGTEGEAEDGVGEEQEDLVETGSRTSDTHDTETVITSSMLKVTDKSPPSSQVLRHLEALEAAIELDLTMQSTQGTGLDQTPNLTTGRSELSLSSAKRRLDLSSPPATSEERPISLNLEAVSPAHSQQSSDNSPRRAISFYVEVDSPRSPRPGLTRRNTISSPRDSPRDTPRDSSDGGVRRSKGGEPNGKSVLPGLDSRIRSSSALVGSPRVEEVPLTPRRIRHESYNTNSSQVIGEKASLIAAHIRGYLTRALMKSYKVQQHIKTIRDTKEILSGYEINPNMSEQDEAFYDRLKETLVQTREKVHNIFFGLTIAEQMTLISSTRATRRDLVQKELQGQLVKPGTARKKMIKKNIRHKAWI